MMSSAALAAAGYTVAIIPNPPSFTTLASVFGINNLGQVVGFANNGTIELSFIGSASGSTLLPMLPGATGTNGYAINDLGEVTGCTTIHGVSQAFIGTTAGITLIPLPTGLPMTCGYAINNSGQVGGTASGAGPDMAFVGTAAGSTVIPLPSGASSTFGNGINASGQVTGYGSVGVASAQKVLIGTTTSSIDVTPPSGWLYAQAEAINSSGQVAGAYELVAGGLFYAFVGNASGLTQIPLPPGIKSMSVSWGSINDSGQVVGGASTETNTGEGFIWDSTNGTQILNNLVPAGWTINNAISINNGGQIAARASFGGVASNVILTPVSPCDINLYGSTNVMDVQGMINEAWGSTSPANDLNDDGAVNVVDVQIDINAALGLGCLIGTTTPASLTALMNPARANSKVHNRSGPGITPQAAGAAQAVAARLPTITAVVSAASLQRGPISPGEVVAVMGAGLGPAAPVGLGIDRTAATLGGVQVWFDGTPAPLTFVSPTRITCIVPYEVSGRGNSSVQVRYQGQTSVSFSLANTAANPALFTADGSGSGPVAVLNQDQTYNAPDNPAAKGSIVALFLTGEGQTFPPGLTGSITSLSDRTPQPVLPVAVHIGWQPASLVLYGEAPGVVSGVMQIHVRIPSNIPSGNLPISVSVGGSTSQNGVTISVRE